MNKLPRYIATASVAALALAATGSALAAIKADGPGAAGQVQTGAGFKGQGLRLRLRAGGQGQGPGQGQAQARRRAAQLRGAFGGTVTAVGSDSLTIDVKRAGKRSAGLVGTSVTVRVDSSTKVTGKGVSQLADVKAGDRVAVVASGDPAQGLTALAIRDVGPIAAERRWLGGTVAAVGPTSVSIAVKKAGKADRSLVGQTVTVAVTGTTQFTGKGAKQLSDVQTDDTVAVSATGDATQGLTAVRLRDVTGTHLHWIAGSVTAVSSSSITVSVKRTGPYDTPLANQTATFAVDSSTVVIRNREGSNASIGDVQTGMTVGVLFSARGRNFTSGLTATRIHIWEKTAVSQVQSDQPTPQPVPAAPAG